MYFLSRRVYHFKCVCFFVSPSKVHNALAHHHVFADTLQLSSAMLLRAWVTNVLILLLFLFCNGRKMVFTQLSEFRALGICDNTVARTVQKCFILTRTHTHTGNHETKRNRKNAFGAFKINLCVICFVWNGLAAHYIRFSFRIGWIYIRMHKLIV